MLLRYHRGFGEHLSLVDHDVQRLIVLLYSFDISGRFHFMLLHFFLRRRRILFAKYSFDVVLKVLVFEISNPFSLLALIQRIF